MTNAVIEVRCKVDNEEQMTALAHLIARMAPYVVDNVDIQSVYDGIRTYHSS
jgi:hypothetical protein